MTGAPPGPDPTPAEQALFEEARKAAQAVFERCGDAKVAAAELREAFGDLLQAHEDLIQAIEDKHKWARVAVALQTLVILVLVARLLLR